MAPNFAKASLTCALDSALVRVGDGVTLRVLTPLNTLARLTVGESVHLHTHFYVREDAMSLFGFSTPDDREMFEQLLGVDADHGRRPL